MAFFYAQKEGYRFRGWMTKEGLGFKGSGLQQLKMQNEECRMMED